MAYENELTVLNTILNFKIPEVSNDTKFWMIRTKKGYFYNEFIGKKFVALAWNSVTCNTDFSEKSREALKDSIVLDYPDIKRPSTVINKCNSFINEVKTNDILVIPSAKSAFITFAFAGEYFEDETKTFEVENKVIYRIDHKDVVIDEVSCPYKKRRHIVPIRTVKSEEINYSLYRAISNYHGISNLDNYSRYILNMIYGIYSYKNDVNIIFNVRKSGPIGPRLLSGILYGATDYLCEIGIEEHKISTQVNINSPGPIDFSIFDIYNWLKVNYFPILALLVVAGGGSFLTFKLPGLPQIIKDILTLSDDIKKKKLETEKAELEVIQKKIELYEKIKSAGINPEDLKKPLEVIFTNTHELNVQPIELMDTNPIDVVVASEEDESEEE